MNLDKIYVDSYDNTVFQYTEKFITHIIDMENKEALKTILKYCEENNIIPNLIDKNRLDLVLKLGINELNKRDLESKGE
jgi:hypothetical protein